MRSHLEGIILDALMMVSLLAVAYTPTAVAQVFPGTDWETRTPAQVGLDKGKLDGIAGYLGGRGCITRHGYMVYTWGDYKRRGDVASAAKPWYSTFLFMAVEQGRLQSLDTKAMDFEPRLGQINSSLGYKDRDITFRHLANQISCYGVTEKPGTAFDYNDWQMALFWDTLFLKVYGATYDNVDTTVFHPLLSDKIGCQDSPTFMAFGTRDRAGRLAVSPRDFCRLGLLYLREGNWNGVQIISKEHARMAVSSPLPLSIPRTSAHAADMISGQRTIGSTAVPDNQADHDGSYSWLWWINGVGRDGKRMWPDGPEHTFTCLGHKNGKRGMAVVPELDIVLSWNDTKLDSYPSEPHPLNEVLRLLVEAAGGIDSTPPSAPSNLSALGEDGPKIVLTWDAAADPETGVSRYRIYRSQSPGEEVFLASVQGPATYVDKAVKAKTGYYYKVSAVNGAGMEGEQSNEASTISGIGPPMAPTGLTARLAGPDRVLLEWKDNSDSEDGFIVESLAGTPDLSIDLAEYNGGNTYPTVEVKGSENSFKEGALVVNDRSDTWSRVPEELRGMTRLLTARNDRQQPPLNSKYVVQVSSGCDVYLPLDPRYNGAKASWMGPAWIDAGMTCDSSVLSGWKIWKMHKEKAGQVTLGCDDGVYDGTCYVFVPSPSWSEVGRIAQASFLLGDLEHGQTYTFRVMAFNAAGRSEPSNTAEITLPQEGAEFEWPELELPPEGYAEEQPGDARLESEADSNDDTVVEFDEYETFSENREQEVATDGSGAKEGGRNSSSGSQGCGCAAETGFGFTGWPVLVLALWLVISPRGPRPRRP
ncbi:MAG: hypothetical protein GXP49_03370 [Deltaproteobacteria bacterium]|nr:hypothetical protein [Deltaproteobacteria bacterium]